MKDIRRRIESKFGAWGAFCTRHPWLVLLSYAVVVGAFSTNLNRLTIDTSAESLLRPDNPIRIAYNEFRHQFGRDERVLLIIDTDKTIYDTEFLTRLKHLHEDLENNAVKVQEVDSLFNARRTYGDGDQLNVDDLLEEIPQTQAELDTLRHVVTNHPLYRGQYIGDTDKSALLYIETDAYSYPEESQEDVLGGFDDADLGFDDEFADSETAGSDEVKEPPPFLTGEDNTAIVKSIDEVISRHQAENFRILAGGSPHMMNTLMITVMRDMTVFSTAVILLISLILGILFRRFVVVFLPLLVSSLSVMLTVSILALLGKPFTTVLQIMPTFLLAVGVSNTVHIFAIFFQAQGKGKNKQESIVYALEHSGFAIAMSAFTTAGGLLSFTVAEIQPVADFGIASAMGIIFALIFSVGLLPALITILPIKNKPLKNPESKLNQRFLRSCGSLAARRPALVLSVWGIVLVSSLISASNMRLSHEPIKWLSEDDPVRISMNRLNDEFGGGMFLEVMIDTDKQGGIKDPELLRRIEQIYQTAYSYEGRILISKAVSILDVAKETHQALNRNDASYYAVPDNRELLAQELLLFENSGSDDLERMVDSQFSKARITFRTTYVDAVYYPEFQETFYRDVENILADYPGFEGDVVFTGFLSTSSETMPALINSLIRSYLLAFLTITPIMMFMLGSWKVGLLSMLPNVAPIVLALGLLGITDIPLDTFTLLIGSIALGLAVDDTIHFMHNYQRFYSEHGDNERAILQSLQTSGQAILFTSIVLVVSFLIYTLSIIAALVNFGILIALCVGVAFLADATLAPSLVTLVAKRKHAGD